MNQLSRLRNFMPLIIDVGVPLAIYYLFHLAGASDFVALTAGGIIPAVVVLFRIIKSRKIDQLGIFMAVMFALGIALLFITGDPRLILAKPALFLLVAAGFCLSTLRTRPAMHAIAKPMATEGNKKLEELWERALHSSEPFQRAIQRSTIGFSIALLIDAIGRVIVVYNLPVSQAVTISNLPGLIALLLAIRYHLVTVKPVFEDIKKKENV